MKHKHIWRLLILLAAVALRLLLITEVPPGLTHDEADHGLSAWGVVQGDRPLYFSVGYGREPLYDYATAGLMAFLGPTYLAGRLTAVFFSLILLAAAYAWVRKAFNERIALLTLAGLALNFWAVMTARHGLRTITLPALFVPAVYFWWQNLAGKMGAGEPRRPSPTLLPFLSGVLLGLTFYTYMAARLLWLLFPVTLLWWGLFERARFRQMWRPTAVMLLTAAIIAAPLFIHLATHPTAEVRLEQLRTPLDAALAGDWSPLRQNALGGLQTLTVTGDTAWRYNLPERPFLTPFMAFFFYLGLAITLWKTIAPIGQKRTPAETNTLPRPRPYAPALIWLLLGLAPVLITGPYLSGTRAIGIQPILFVFPALAIDALWRWGLPDDGRPTSYGTAAALAVALIYAGGTFETAQAYFFEWGPHPEVRIQYETTLVETIAYLERRGSPVAALSTPTPGRFHSQPVGLLTRHAPALSLRWFDGRHSLIIPQAAEVTYAFPAFAGLGAGLERYFRPARQIDTLALQANDLNRPVTIYTADGFRLLESVQTQFAPPEHAVTFGGRVQLLGHALQPATLIHPGDVVTVATLWRVQAPLEADTVLFTQLIGPDGLPMAQADRLDVPSNAWQPGDVFIQVHQFQLPAETPPGDFPLLTGFYTRPTLQRLPITSHGALPNDAHQLQRLTITP